MIAAYEPLSIKELIELDIPDPQWLVDGLITQGSFVLLTAREKSGKGLLTVDLVSSIAEGSEFLNRTTAQGPAIYCATEESVQEVRSRFQARAGDNIDLPAYALPLDGSTSDTLDIMDDTSLKKLEGMIDQSKPRLVVIDVLREIHNGKEDSSDDMAPVMKRLRTLARTYDSTIVLNHHMSKSGQARGSTSIAAGVDSVLEMSPNDHIGQSLGGQLTAKGRSVPKQTLNITFGENGRWAASTSSPPAVREVTARQRILAHLEANDTPQTIEQIAAAIERSPKTVGNELSRMSSEPNPPIHRTSSGNQGGSFLYSAKAPPDNVVRLDSGGPH